MPSNAQAHHEPAGLPLTLALHDGVQLPGVLGTQLRDRYCRLERDDDLGGARYSRRARDGRGSWARGVVNVGLVVQFDRGVLVWANGADLDWHLGEAG